MERSTTRYRERQRNGSCDFGKINGRRIRDRIETRVMGERGRRHTVKECEKNNNYEIKYEKYYFNDKKNGFVPAYR
jgi:hypothetical protein